MFCRRLTKNRHGLSFILSALLGVLIGCANPADPKPNKPAPYKPITLPKPGTPEEKILRAVRARKPESLYSSTLFHPAGTKSIPAGANVVLIIHGGPVLDESQIKKTGPTGFDKTNLPPNPAKWVRVLVRQEQMIRFKNGTLPKRSFITPEKAEEINLYSAAIVYALAEHFKIRGHKVSLYSFSFGSFIVPEMYRQYGDAPFNKVLIATGRLNMPKPIYEDFFNGRPRGFCAFDATLRECIPDGVTIEAQNSVNTDRLERTTMRLQADLGRNNYTKLLKDKNLSKIIYYFAGKDGAVGRLKDKELQFLTGRPGVKVTGTPPTTPDASRRVNVSGKNYTVNTLNGADGRAAVKYSLTDGHAIDSLLGTISDDLTASFNP